MSPQSLKEIRDKQRANRKRYHEEHKNDPEYKAKQKAISARWWLKKKLKKQLEKEQS